MSDQRGAGQRLPRTVVLLATILTLVAVAGCDQTQVWSSPGRHYPDTALGKAKLMRDATPRIRSVVDVSEAFPGHASLNGAVVLVDAQLGNGLALADFELRPVLARYASADAASLATRDDLPTSIEVRGSDVLYLPPNLPAKAADVYRRAMYVGLE